MDFFGRLREERARLGLTQQAVADAAEVNVKTVRRWETVIAVPFDALVPLVGVGYDVQYLASGVRSKNIHEVREKGVDYEVSPGATRDEVELLRSYRALAAPQRKQARAMLQVLALKSPAAKRAAARAARESAKEAKATAAATRKPARTRGKPVD